MAAKLNSTNHRTYDSSALVDTTGGTIACWIYIPTGSGDVDYIKSANGRVHLHYTSSVLTLDLKTSADAAVVSLTYGDPAKDEWHQFLFAGTGASYATYLDGAGDAHTEVSAAAGTVDWSNGLYAFGNTSATSYLQDLYMSTTVQTVSTVDDRNLFWTEPSKYLTNRMPTGMDTVPSPYFIATPILDDLTKVGVKLYSDIDGPTSDQFSGQGFKGEAWSTCDLCGWQFPESELVLQPETNRKVCTTGPRDYDKPSRDGHRNTPNFFIY